MNLDQLIKSKKSKKSQSSNQKLTERQENDLLKGIYEYVKYQDTLKK